MDNEYVEVLIDEAKIKKRVEELALQISNDFQGQDITLVCILKGAVMFMVDIAKKLKEQVEIDFMDVSSYGDGTVSTGKLKINKDVETSLEGKNVLIVEDIIDTGRTLSYLKEYLLSKNPKTLKICTLLDKPDRRILDVKADYVGFDIPDDFVVGYGLDYAQRYRNLSYIGILNFKE